MVIHKVHMQKNHVAHGPHAVSGHDHIATSSNDEVNIGSQQQLPNKHTHLSNAQDSGENNLASVPSNQVLSATNSIPQQDDEKAQAVIRPTQIIHHMITRSKDAWDF